MKLQRQSPEAKQAALERERILKALGDNRDKQAPLSEAITSRGDIVQLRQEIGGLTGANPPRDPGGGWSRRAARCFAFSLFQGSSFFRLRILFFITKAPRSLRPAFLRAGC
jgi:hypothetical protein